ncbi:hypothetical protein O1L60_35545 [Streptomyces diastatochromogenes]|nr:hypothetical protein [Streptomyces diastatochromogenes]
MGTRILFRTPHRDPAPDHYLVESVDGRSARFAIDRQGQKPWALWAPPEGAAEDVVLAEAETRTGVRAYTADGVLLWELDGHHSPRHPGSARPGAPPRPAASPCPRPSGTSCGPGTRPDPGPCGRRAGRRRTPC